MGNFRNWLERKGFEIEEGNICFYVSDGVHPTLCKVILNKQMLIGYMIEYLEEVYQQRHKLSYIVPSGCGMNLYEELKKDINKL